MIISHSHKFVFVHIHKTGGTSLERALDPYLAWNDLILGGSKFGEQIQQSYAKKYGLNKHSTVSDIETICGRGIINEYYVFSLVRHPLSRLCSLYNFVATSLHDWANKQKIDFDNVERYITREAARAKPSLMWPSTKAFLGSRSFSEFIRHGDLSAAPGFRQQVASLGGQESTEIRAHFFRLEDCPTWLDPLQEKIGIEFAFQIANQSRVKLIDEHAVADEDRAYVESVFQLDYESFGYKP